MENLKRIPKAYFLFGYSLLAAFLTAATFRLGFPTATLALLVVPIAVAASIYSDRFYWWPAAVGIISGLSVVLGVSAHVRTSSEMLTGVFVMTVVLCEFIHRQTQAQARLQAEISSLARFPAEKPNPVLRLAPDGSILYSNQGARDLLNLWSSTDDDEAPLHWRALVSQVLQTGQRLESEACFGDRCFVCVLVPADDRSYVNVYAVDITERRRATAALEQQREYLTALHETTLGLMNRLDSADLLQAIVGRATQLIHADYGWLYLVDTKADLLEARFATEGFREYLGQHLHRGEGLAGLIWQTGRPHAIDDYRRWPHRSAAFPPQMVRAAMGAPLISGSQILGVLGVSITESDRTFHDAELVLLDRFARLAAVALDNARLFAATQRQTQELSLLHQVRTETARQVELPDLIKTVVEATAQTFDYDLVSLYLLRDGALHLQHQVGYDQVLTVIPITSGVTGRAVRTGKPILLEDVHLDRAFLEAMPGITSEVCVPLFDQGEVAGVLNVEKMGAARLSEADLRILTALGQHVSSAISQARLYAEARESEQRYRSVVENVAEVIFQTDSKGHWTFLSPAWTKITGYAVADSLGRPMVEFLHPDDSASFDESYAQLLNQQRTTCRCVIRLVTPEGGFRWVEGRGHMRYADDGSPQGLLGTLTDITEQKQAEAALQQERDFALQVMAALGQGLVVTGPDGCIEYANPALARMLDLPAEQLVGKRPEEFIAFEDQPWAMAASQTGETASRELCLRGAGDGIRYVLWTSSPRWRDGQVIGAIALVTDVTERKHMEEALAEARDRALVSSRLKSEFLARASHEIRTPMNSIIGTNELLLETPLTAGQREHAETMQHSANALLEIIDDILDFTRAEAGKMRYVAVDFAPALVIDDVIALFARKVQAKQLELNVEIEPEATAPLRGDPGRLRQVLINLISNAVKFTDRGVIHVRARLVERTPESVILRFEIQDTGIGVPTAARHRLFQPFAQVDGANAPEEGGSGLGLAICKQLVELMDGQIGMESQEGIGSTFWFTARFAHASAAPERNAAEGRRASAVVEAPREPAAARPLILLVEDNPVNRRLAILQLERLGYAADAAADGYQALDALARNGAAYSLILMDCQMPDLDGLEATRAIRQDEAAEGRHTPIIAMTANATPKHRTACSQAGMDDFISKPVRLKELGEALRRWLPSPAPASATSAAPTPGESAFASEPSAAEPAVDAAALASLRSLAETVGPGEFTDLLDAFLATAESRVVDLMTASALADHPQLYQAAHSLRGSCASFGAHRLAALCADLEHASAADGGHRLVELARQAAAEYQRVRQAVIAARGGAS